MESIAKIELDLFKKIVFSVCPGFVVDSSIKELMNNLYYYVNDDAKGSLDIKKGILLWGDIGTGKSTIIRITGELLRFKGNGYKTVNCSWLTTQYAHIGLEALNSSTYNEVDMTYKPVNRAFDELGREPIPARHYGNELNVMQYVFQCRYELRDMVKTFATTNLRPDSIEKIYGTYIADRINEMFNIVEIRGKSRRNKLK